MPSVLLLCYASFDEFHDSVHLYLFICRHCGLGFLFLYSWLLLLLIVYLVGDGGRLLSCRHGVVSRLVDGRLGLNVGMAICILLLVSARCQVQLVARPDALR